MVDCRWSSWNSSCSLTTVAASTTPTWSSSFRLLHTAINWCSLCSNHGSSVGQHSGIHKAHSCFRWPLHRLLSRYESISVCVSIVVLAANATLGNFVGPLVFKTKDAPRYVPAFIVVTITAIVAAVIVVVYRFICVWQNKQRDQAGIAEAFDHAYEDDLTDLKVFFYIQSHLSEPCS
jgi:hypothetical protein